MWFGTTYSGFGAWVYIQDQLIGFLVHGFNFKVVRAPGARGFGPWGSVLGEMDIDLSRRALNITSSILSKWGEDGFEVYAALTPNWL